MQRMTTGSTRTPATMGPGRFADQIPGGRADQKSPKDFDPEQLAAGTQHEMEHTKDEAKAREIAMDHLAEDKHYYKKLNKAGL